MSKRKDNQRRDRQREGDELADVLRVACQPFSAWTVAEGRCGNLRQGLAPWLRLSSLESPRWAKVSLSDCWQALEVDGHYSDAFWEEGLTLQEQADIARHFIAAADRYLSGYFEVHRTRLRGEFIRVSMEAGNTVDLRRSVFRRWC